MKPQLTYSMADLAEVFGHSREMMHKKLPQLAKLDFPPKLPGFNRWSAVAVNAWIANHGGGPVKPKAANTDTPEIDQPKSSPLEGRYL